MDGALIHVTPSVQFALREQEAKRRSDSSHFCFAGRRLFQFMF
jgi:hypothetical protein